MKQSTLIIFLVIFSLLFTLHTARVNNQSKHGRKLMSKHSIHSAIGVQENLMITDYTKGGDSGGPAECDGKYHSNDKFLVSLPTTWYNDGKNCNKGINISYKGMDVIAVVIDECGGCSDDVLVASKAVWRGLHVPESQWGDEIQVIWSYVN
ncbi:putative ripening-related protein 2 [Rutidosis leptorrhynchoides]|uniref:putative ripening-related protein 2 n=1 Tax=Rutidosis leptorrhynchoides TaxID=125765 RepID=UPI003A9A467F